jgi:hypothetical protein
MRQLQRALISGFTDDELRNLVRLDLDESLDAIVSSGSLSKVAFDLIWWAERQGRTEELIKAVIAANPQNQEIAALGNLLPGPVGKNPEIAAPGNTLRGPAAVDPAVADADRRRQLRGLLLDQFPREADLAMLLDDSLGQDLKRVAGGGNQTEIYFYLVHWLWVDRGGRLRPFLAAAVRERPNCEDLKVFKQQLFPD